MDQFEVQQRLKEARENIAQPFIGTPAASADWKHRYDEVLRQWQLTDQNLHMKLVELEQQVAMWRGRAMRAREKILVHLGLDGWDC